MRIVILCIAAVVFIVLVAWVAGVFNKTPESERSLKWLNQKYLFHLEEAKKNNDKNEPVMEFHMEEAARYKELMNRATGKAFLDEMKSLPRDK